MKKQMATVTPITNGERVEQNERDVRAAVAQLLAAGVFPSDITLEVARQSGCTGAAMYAGDTLRTVENVLWVLGIAVESGELDEQAILDVQILVTTLLHQVRVYKEGGR